MSTADLMLTIYSIQLEIKFPCRMSLHHNGKPLTAQLEPKDNLFTFNQDVNIKTDAEGDLEIDAYLATQKGGSILAGIITAPISTLISKQNQVLTLTLKKCIDAGATARIKVNHTWVQHAERQMNMTRSSAGGFQFKATNLSPPNKSKLKTEVNPFETKSQFQGNKIRRNPTGVMASYMHKNNFESPRNLNTRRDFVGVIPRISIKNEYGNHFEEEMHDTRTLGGIQGRQRKSREKQRLASRKVADETENNLKMDVMKYKMKSEELDKIVNEKTKNIKELKDQILQFERRNIEKAYIQEELTSKQSTIQVLQDRITNLNSENINLRQTIADQVKMIGELKENIRFDIMKNKEDFEKKANQLRHQLAAEQAKNNQLEMEVNNRTAGLNKAKKYIEDLQAAAEQKIFQHDRLMQDLKKAHAHTLKEMTKVRQQNQARIQQLIKQLQNKSAVISKANQQIMTLQQQQRGSHSHIQNLEVERAELLIIKSEHINLVKKYGALEESMKEEQKGHRKTMEQKNKEIKDNSESLNKIIKDLEAKISSSYEKNKQMKQKIQQLQNSLMLSKNEEEKYKKIIQKNDRILSEQNAKIQGLLRDAKSSQTRIANLEKELHNKSSNTSHMESLYKIQLEHSRENVNSLTRELEDTNNKLSITKQNLQLSKNEKTKLENKIQLMQENQARLNEYLKQKKNQFQTKQNDYKHQISINRGQMKKIESILKGKQTDINNWELSDLNNKNKIQKLQKNLEEALNKSQKLQKVTIVKISEERQKLRAQLETVKQRLKDAIEQNKYITNQTKKLESETSKNSKINDLLSGEKLQLLNEINKLKNMVTRYEKNEEKLGKDLKTAQQDIKKQLLKIQSLEKQNSKNRDLLNQTLSTVYQAKKISNVKSVFSEMPSKIQRKKESIIDNLETSRVGMLSPSQNYDVRKISQIIESMSREQQSTIQALQDNITHYKENVARLENQLSTQNFMYKSNEQRMQQNNEKLTIQLEQINAKMLDMTNHYEDRISKLENQKHKKDKDLKLSKSTIGSLKYEIQTLKNKMQIMNEEGEVRENRSHEKNQELESEVHYFQLSIKTLENDKKILENQCLQMEDQIQILKEQNQHLEKQLGIRNKKLAQVTLENGQNSKYRKQHLQQLLSLKQQLQALKEDNQKTKQLLKDQQKSNKNKQDFINDLIKQKQAIVKAELQSSSKVIEMQNQVIELKTKNDGLEQMMGQKEIQIGQLKGTIKQNVIEAKNYENEIKENQSKIGQLNGKIEEKEQKISEKQNQYQQLNQSYNEFVGKHKEQVKKLKEEMEKLQEQMNQMTEEKNEKIVSLERDISSLQVKVDKGQKDLMQRQQTIFFEKQKSSLNQSMINELKKQISQMNLAISKSESEIQELTNQLNTKEETLFDYSGKIYQLEQMLEMKEIQGNKRVEKMDYEWQCRHDQICEEYEQKIQILEKQKRYQREKLDILENQKVKMMEDKASSLQQFEKDLGSTKVRSKELEEEKLHQLNLKNKQIQKYKSELSTMEKQMKNNQIQTKKKQNQILNKEQAIKKLQSKMREHDQQIDHMHKKFEKEIQEFKKKETQLKNYKQEIKNMQWVVERQCKKITQLFIQKVIACCPEAKEKLVEPIRSLETAMGSAINFKV